MNRVVPNLAIAVSLSGLLGTRVARAQWIEFTGTSPGGIGSRVYALTPDGATAAGGLVATPAGGFTWTRAAGRTDYGQLPGMPGSSHAFAISSDGQTTAGMTTNTAYRYRLGEPALQLLGIQPGYTSSKAQGISGDGEIVVGMSRAGQTDEFAEAFRWTSTTGLVGLGYLQPGQSYSEAAAISRDGSAIVGFVTQTTGFNQAFVWREGTGMVGLPGLDATNDGQARAVNLDGTIIVGHSRPGPFQRAATMWVSGIPVNLGVPAGFVRSVANSVSTDGSVVVGQLDGNGQTAAIWTPARGMEPLSIYLAFHGISVPSGINLLTATAVSADGRTIAGYSGPPGQVREGFVVHIPSPATLLVFPALFAARLRRRN